MGHALASRGLRGAQLYWPLLRRLSNAPDGFVDFGDGHAYVYDADDWAARSLYEGTYERAELSLLPRLVSPGTAVIDVGASLGAYTARAARLVGAAGLVLAFEPAPRCISALYRTISASGHLNVQIHEVALGDSRAQSSLRLLSPGRHSGLSTLRAVDGEASVSVDVRRLDEYVPLLGDRRVSLLKVDVEGYEERVLAGAEELLGSGRVDAVLVEVSPEFGSTDYAVRLVESTSGEFAAFAVSERGALVRRPALEPVDGRSVAVRSKQFNLLVLRRERVHRVQRFVTGP